MNFFNYLIFKKRDVIYEDFIGKKKGVALLQNKEPVWNEETNSYMLNFRGRVTKPSVKNFQLISDHDSDYILMQFGRTGTESFSMDVLSPIDLTVGFAIAITSLDVKLACE